MILKAQWGLFSLLLFVAATPRLVRAQTSIPNLFNPLSASSPGVHLYGVSVFSGYYKGSAPFAVPIAVQTPSDPSYDVAVGATASFGWNRSGERSGLSVNYSTSYFGSVRHSEYNTFGHSFSASTYKQLHKWTLTFTASAGLSNYEQSIFNPSALTTVASIPTTFDDLASAILGGSFTNSQLASILTATPPLQSPEQAFLYGSRFLSTSLGTGLSYSISKRSSIQIGINASRSQTLQSSAPSSVNGPILAPHSNTGGGINLGWSYSLNPRTTISTSLGASRSFSTIESGYGTSANVSASRTMSRRLFLQGSVGAGTLLYVRHTFPIPGTVQYIGSASAGFKTFAQTFLVSYNRTLGDSYGAGSGSTSGVTGSWHWKHPGSAWSVFSNFGYQRLANQTLHNPTSWQGGAGAARGLGSHTFMSVQYIYLRYLYRALSNPDGIGLSQNGVSLALTWSPSTYR